MGGRIALMFAATYPERVKKLIILSAHPGLDDRERGARKNWEEEWLSKMEDRLNFLKLWYGQPLFKSLKASPHFQKILLRRTQVDLARQSSLFKGYRLSDQKSFWPDLVNLPVTFFFGGKDEKFLPIHNRLVKMNIKSHIIQDGGHAFHLENQNCHKQIFGDAL